MTIAFDLDFAEQWPSDDATENHLSSTLSGDDEQLSPILPDGVGVDMAVSPDTSASYSSASPLGSINPADLMAMSSTSPAATFSTFSSSRTATSSP
jgi:hypothetical protein